MKAFVHTNKVIEHAGQEIMVRGFVHALRAQSKIAFLVIRDVKGTIQGVIGKESPAFETAKGLSIESVVEVYGLAKKAEQAPGGVEIEVESIVVLSKAAPELPIPVVTLKGGEETEAPIRFDYRWIDLRKPEKTKNA